MTPSHHIVQLDGNVQLLTPDFPHTFEKYISTKPSEIAERLREATICIATGTRMTYDTLKTCGPKLQLLLSLGVGYDNFDIRAIKERNLTLVNVPAQNTESVAEHAYAVLGAVKRNIVPLHRFTVEGVEWEKNSGTVSQFKRCPKTNREETMGIIGYGAIGRCAEKMAKALGMQVVVAERKGAIEARSGRATFEEVLKRCTVLIASCPLDESTHNMIDKAELQTMREDAILINVGRGGIINELALANALKEFRIAGGATDVFETEPATKENCPLLDPSIPNLVLTPHIAWYSTGTIKGTIEVTKKNLERFVAGEPQNVITGPSKG